MRSGATSMFTGSGPGYGGTPSGPQATARTSDPWRKVRKFWHILGLNCFNIMKKELWLSAGNPVEENPLRNRTLVDLDVLIQFWRKGSKEGTKAFFVFVKQVFTIELRRISVNQNHVCSLSCLFPDQCKLTTETRYVLI